MLWTFWSCNGLPVNFGVKRTSGKQKKIKFKMSLFWPDLQLAIMPGVILIQSGQSLNKKLSQIEMRMLEVQVLCTSTTSLQVCCFLGECAKFTYTTQNLWNKMSWIMNVSSYYGSSHTTTATSLFKLYCTVMCVKFGITRSVLNIYRRGTNWLK